MLVSGQSLTEIAEKLNLSIKTISTHKARLMQKMNAGNQAELIRYARDNPAKLTVAAANPPTIFTMAQLRTREKLDIASKDYPIDAAAMDAL